MPRVSVKAHVSISKIDSRKAFTSKCIRSTTKTKTTKKQTAGCWFGDLAKNKKAKTCTKTKTQTVHYIFQ